MKQTFLLIISICLFAACGPSAKEKAAMEVLKQDSINRAIAFRKDSIEAQAYHKDSIQKVITAHNDSIKKAQAAYNDSIQQAQTTKAATIAALQSNLDNVVAQLVAANDKLKQIQQFQIGRSQSTREAQIQNQTLVVLKLRDLGTSIKAKIQALQRQQ